MNHDDINNLINSLICVDGQGLDCLTEYNRLIRSNRLQVGDDAKKRVQILELLRTDYMNNEPSTLPELITRINSAYRSMILKIISAGRNERLRQKENDEDDVIRDKMSRNEEIKPHSKEWLRLRDAIAAAKREIYGRIIKEEDARNKWENYLQSSRK